MSNKRGLYPGTRSGFQIMLELVLFSLQHPSKTRCCDATPNKIAVVLFADYAIPSFFSKMVLPPLILETVRIGHAKSSERSSSKASPQLPHFHKIIP